VSTLDVVAEVLREVAPRALNARQIVELANGRLPTASRTPETVVSRDLAMELKRNETRSRFLRVDRGKFVIKEALPTAFYNEIEPYAAQWSRNLIAAGEVAAGVVDERSIRDLKPADVASYRQCHFFSGISVWSRALRDAGWPDDSNVWSGSCPCTPFSSAGRKQGFADEQHLWPEWFRLIAACRPALIVGEQVSSKDGLTWLDTVRVDLESADYSLRVLDTPAVGVGAPHRRSRLYFAAYARERGREILSASWLHDRWQPRYDAARRSSVDSGNAVILSDAERVGAGCCCAEAGVAQGDAGLAGPQRRVPRASGWDGITGAGSPDAVDASIELGDASLARGRRDAGAFPRAEEACAGERIEARDLPDELVAPSTDDGAVRDEVRLVRGAADIAVDGSFRPGDRIRIDGDPSWGGAVRGFWADDVEWIYCRPEPGHQDGRWRPTRSGIEPLAARSSTDLGRTRAKRLKCFGNSIVLPLATAFVEAVIETFADAAWASLPLPAVAPAPAPIAEPLPSVAPAPAPIAEPLLSVASAPIADLAAWKWTGPRGGETAPSGMLYGRVPGDRWPYGPPPFHEPACNLFPHRGSPGGLFCDCMASAADDVAHGVGA